jgi:predicted metal-dependent phosphoesterase TrpH
MLKRFVADLHIHTCLSPCAELDMTPLRIVEKAVAKGLDIIAISDHNSAENVGVALEVAASKGLALLPAMEITSSEEVHVLAVFGTAEGAVRMQDTVYKSLPEGTSSGVFGEQLVVNERDEVMEFNSRPLFGATSMGLGALVNEIRSLGGLAIASHIDRQAFGVIGQLGFIPDDVVFDAFEVTRPREADALLGSYADVPRICSSDAHYLDDIGSRTTSFNMQEASFEEIRMALKGSGGRGVNCN